MAQKYTLSHRNFAKIHCFKRILKGILPHDTLSHNFLINCNTLSHNFYQKRTPYRIIFTVKGHPVEWLIPSSQVWEYPRDLSLSFDCVNKPPPLISPLSIKRPQECRKLNKPLGFNTVFKPSLLVLIICLF